MNAKTKSKTQNKKAWKYSAARNLRGADKHRTLWPSKTFWNIKHNWRSAKRTWCNTDSFAACSYRTAIGVLTILKKQKEREWISYSSRSSAKDKKKYKMQRSKATTDYEKLIDALAKKAKKLMKWNLERFASVFGWIGGTIQPSHTFRLSKLVHWENVLRLELKFKSNAGSVCLLLGAKHALAR